MTEHFGDECSTVTVDNVVSYLQLTLGRKTDCEMIEEHSGDFIIRVKGMSLRDVESYCPYFSVVDVHDDTDEWLQFVIQVNELPRKE